MARKETTNMARCVGTLQKMFRALNAEFFNNELAEPILSIQSSPLSYGHFTPWDAYRIHGSDGDRGAVEINIASGTLDRPIENVTATLLHEMVHYYCYLNNIKDCSRGNQYHNHRFRDEAVKRGLTIEYDSRIGWSITSPNEDLLDFIIRMEWTDIRLGRNDFTGHFIGGVGKAGSGTGVAPILPKKKGNSIKWICPSCGAIVRSTRMVNIECGDCHEAFIQA